MARAQHKGTEPVWVDDAVWFHGIYSCLGLSELDSMGQVSRRHARLVRRTRQTDMFGALLLGEAHAVVAAGFAARHKDCPPPGHEDPRVIRKRCLAEADAAFGNEGPETPRGSLLARRVLMYSVRVGGRWGRSGQGLEWAARRLCPRLHGALWSADPIGGLEALVPGDAQVQVIGRALRELHARRRLGLSPNALGILAASVLRSTDRVRKLGGVPDFIHGVGMCVMAAANADPNANVLAPRVVFACAHNGSQIYQVTEESEETRYLRNLCVIGQASQYDMARAYPCRCHWERELREHIESIVAANPGLPAGIRAQIVDPETGLTQTVTTEEAVAIMAGAAVAADARGETGVVPGLVVEEIE